MGESGWGSVSGSDGHSGRGSVGGTNGGNMRSAGYHYQVEMENGEWGIGNWRGMVKLKRGKGIEGQTSQVA